jgi:hypothetical protein
MDSTAVFKVAPEILKLYWYQYLSFFFYAFILGVGLRFLRKTPGLGIKDVWKYINENTKEVANAGFCWLIVFGLWATAPQWTPLVKWEWIKKLNYFYDMRYWSPLVAWLSDSIISFLLWLGSLGIVWAQKVAAKWMNGKTPPPDSTDPSKP